MCYHEDVFAILEECLLEEKSLHDFLEIHVIQEQVLNNDAELRALIAKALAFGGDTQINVELLSKLANDDNADVRLESVDSLSAYCSNESFLLLHTALKDEDEYVRAYAAHGLGVVGKEIRSTETVAILKQAIEAEKHNPYVLVSIYEALYILDEYDFLLPLMQLFDNEDYHIKCCVLRSLVSILNKDNFKVIQMFISCIENITMSVAVKDALTELKTEIARQGGQGDGSVVPFGKNE